MIVHNACKAIVDTLMKEYICFPTGQDLKNVIDGFESKWGLHQFASAIDGSHIPIFAPELNHTDYYNRKGRYPMVVQAVVDHDYVFKDLMYVLNDSVAFATLVFSLTALFTNV